ncbi:hypothetical protein BU24DRAFT_20649 [Aaosphaeria arxii CBS 175.79]|uniref:Chromo domain-containing protein n=1 Tax=Aaosphaeria arxii CBS 175.79 TaxID=1450172 RepID=A0A6A5Y9X8_9PLEO|nr:uncharacterized protein BU24DRAFT_20649 [Aaosphaeria arxii CBS 175.79]KAF2021404.1 hypothetical protein BU24DRAFT_20649 [Aaosphaeria arxii CBS 175.79]
MTRSVLHETRSATHDSPSTPAATPRRESRKRKRPVRYTDSSDVESSLPGLAPPATKIGAASARRELEDDGGQDGQQDRPGKLKRIRRGRRYNEPLPFSSEAEDNAVPHKGKQKAVVEKEGEEEDDDEEEEEPGEKLWAAVRILSANSTKYLIEWEDIDPATGVPYEPTWEDKKCANAALRAEWTEQQRKEKKEKREKILEGRKKARERKRQSRGNKVPQEQGEKEKGNDKELVQVHVQPGSQFDAADFERFSQLPGGSSQITEIQQQTQMSSLPSSSASSSVPDASNKGIAQHESNKKREETFSDISTASQSYANSQDSFIPGSEPQTQSQSAISSKEIPDTTTTEVWSQEAEYARTPSPFVRSQKSIGQLDPIETSSQLQQQSDPQTDAQSLSGHTFRTEEENHIDIEIPESPEQAEPESLEQIDHQEAESQTESLGRTEQISLVPDSQAEDGIGSQPFQVEEVPQITNQWKQSAPRSEISESEANTRTEQQSVTETSHEGQHSPLQSGFEAVSEGPVTPHHISPIHFAQPTPRRSVQLSQILQIQSTDEDTRRSVLVTKTLPQNNQSADHPKSGIATSAKKSHPRVAASSDLIVSRPSQTHPSSSISQQPHITNTQSSQDSARLSINNLLNPSPFENSLENQAPAVSKSAPSSQQRPYSSRPIGGTTINPRPANVSSSTVRHHLDSPQEISLPDYLPIPATQGSYLHAQHSVLENTTQASQLPYEHPKSLTTQLHSEDESHQQGSYEIHWTKPKVVEVSLPRPADWQVKFVRYRPPWRTYFGSGQKSQPSITSSTTPIVESVYHSNPIRGFSQQNAQIVQPEVYIDSQESLSSIYDTVEVAPSVDRAAPKSASPASRHDSSQESPLVSASGDLSSIPEPPSQSLDGINSTAPHRPISPGNTMASGSGSHEENMSPEDQEYQRRFQEKIDQAVAKARADYKPRKLLGRAAETHDEGTRSPSTIPDQSPQRQEPASLRTTAIISAAVEMTETPHLVPPPPPPPAAPAPTPISNPTPVVQEAPDVQVTTDEDIELEHTESSEDSESLLQDDFGLLPEEHIVALALEGRQRSMYLDEINRHEDLINKLLQNADEFNETEKLDNVLRRLHAIETHMDLIWAESESTSQMTGALTQAQWDCDSSVKFRFLGTFFHALREQDMNIAIVVENDNTRLLDMLEKFCKGKFLNYKYPAKGRSSDVTTTEGSLYITLLSYESSPVMRPPDVVICVDGTLNATQIRKKPWAANPDRPAVPILDLVIPRSVSHIERYVSNNLGTNRRLHTIFAALSQIISDVGRPLSRTPSAISAAREVANFVQLLQDPNVHEPPEWPLPLIGSVKSEIEYASQQTEVAMTSPPPEVPTPLKLSKRPLDEEVLDPAKRMRMTPQPIPNTNESGTENPVNVTQASDSVPSSAVSIAELQEQLRRERELRKASDKRAREFEAALDKRHLDYENLKRDHLAVMNEMNSTKIRMEAMLKSKQQVQDRYDALTVEVNTIREQQSHLQSVALASEDIKTAEIARLTDALATSTSAEAKAQKKITTADSTLEYTKEQYRLAQDRASELSTENAALQAEVATLRKSSTDQRLKLKMASHAASHAVLEKKVERAHNENAILSRLLQQKEEEIKGLKEKKSGGYGTRGSSVPRSPRVGAGGAGSRAASPVVGGNGRDRISNLRNG